MRNEGLNSDIGVIFNHISHPKKRAFLENYPKFLRTIHTTKAIGIREATVYDWIRTDEVFSVAFAELKKRIDSDRLEEIEREIHNRAMGGTSKQSDILLMFEAKALDPSKYREKTPETHLVGDIIVKLAVPPYTDNPVEPPKQLKQRESELP